ncbi:uncharacterized protein TNIN_155101 [Trichonephila inaurata madagascariensis]|uniref:Uncharacterized protein n=1 Tax=Trichonephila inaurata madagascariensis TaxID=2747483 RepID=A0A8X7CID0_9ARAC|nr:uncharacterized protein TNIN_155101 [Trichonephila inaurata madagascariensis]
MTREKKNALELLSLPSALLPEDRGSEGKTIIKEGSKNAPLEGRPIRACCSAKCAKVIANGIDTPVENGLSQKERLPTFQIDTVPSPPWSPVEEPLDEEEIDIQLEEEQQEEEPPEESASDSLSEEQRESLRTFIEDILSKAMVVAEKKLQFVGIDDDDEDEEADEEEIQNHHVEEVEVQEVEEEEEKEVRLTEEEEAEIRAAAEKVVEEVLSKAEELVAEKMADTSNLDFPITFDEAPDDVKDVASNLIKEIVGKAITMAEEKTVPTVPFNFEDVDLIKSSGPWYVRVREGFMRVLRTACFCTPRRHDS